MCSVFPISRLVFLHRSRCKRTCLNLTTAPVCGHLPQVTSGKSVSYKVKFDYARFDARTKTNITRGKWRTAAGFDPETGSVQRMMKIKKSQSVPVLYGTSLRNGCLVPVSRQFINGFKHRWSDKDSFMDCVAVEERFRMKIGNICLPKARTQTVYFTWTRPAKGACPATGCRVVHL